MMNWELLFHSAEVQVRRVMERASHDEHPGKGEVVEENGAQVPTIVGREREGGSKKKRKTLTLA